MGMQMAGPQTACIVILGSRIVINPESTALTLHWHHAPEQPTQGGPFYSRHYRGFEERKEGEGA
jgi:hypothetical protein